MKKLSASERKRKIYFLLFLEFLFIWSVSVMLMPIPAAAYIGSVLTTDIGEKTFTVGTAQEFSFASTANDDLGTMVKGSFVFSDPDAIELLEYKETRDGNWYSFSGEFGPDTGFPLSDAVSTFRVTFRKAGSFDVTVSVKDISDGTAVCSASESVTVKASVAASSNEGGTVTLNGNETELLTVSVGSDRACDHV